MPLYEDRRNAENLIEVSQACQDAVICGTGRTFEVIIDSILQKQTLLNRRVVAAFDGWYGIDWNAIVSALKQRLASEGRQWSFISAHSLYQSAQALRAYKQPFITDDPAFGYVNTDGRIEEIMDAEKIGQLQKDLDAVQENVVLYGCGSATPLMADRLDMTFYFDKTRQPILWQMWDGELVPFGADQPNPEYSWKEYYYNDYHMLDHQKDYLYDRMDFWVEAISAGALKIVPGKYYREIIRTLLKYPIKEIKIYQPGPWGAYRYRDLFEVPGLECNAWNELAGPELGMIVDIGGGKRLEMPMLNLMAYQAEYLGQHIAENYPRLFPMDVWLDDGYFPKKTPIERTAMPIHNHPSTGYVRRHFNEPLGRYETYYICEAYQDACTILGYRDDANVEEWEEVCRQSNNLTPIDNWKDYFSVWDSNIGDLYLIPPGTAHGHGGNQMVLEMDTCPSISATEYSFFEYDFARNSWDDRKKTMTAPPMKMHIEHSFDNEHWRRASWVRENLLSRPKVMKWTKDYKFDRYHSIPEMPFEIERFHFYTQADNDTQGKFAHILTLTIGKRVQIRSLSDPKRCTELELFQSAIIPAAFGAYEIISLDGGFCEVVQMRWKKG